MRILTSILILATVNASAFGQSNPATPEMTAINQVCEYLRLTPDDIGFRQDYTDVDSFRLATVARLMTRPLGMIEFADNLRDMHVKGQPEIVCAIMSKQLAWVEQATRGRTIPAPADELRKDYTLAFKDHALNQLLTRISSQVDVILPRSTQIALGQLTAKQRAFLIKDFKELQTSRVEEESFTPTQLDSVERAHEKIAEKFAEFGKLFDRDAILSAGVECLREVLLEVNVLRDRIAADTGLAKRIMEGAAVFPKGASPAKYLGRQPGWKVGGPGSDRFTGDLSVVIDLGGDDFYDLTYDPSNPHPVIIIDLGGNDCYQGSTDFTLGSGCLSTGILLDFAGDDSYRGRSFSVGSGFFGFGVLYDAVGNDIYDGDTHVEGAGSFGLGLVIDESGRDQYSGALYAQGYGFTGGLGAIIDLTGNDRYDAGGKYRDLLRYADHYLSLSQGFGQGLRPILSGGIGAIIDGSGNDIYSSDIFAQAASYWWSLGVIHDREGNDTYNSFQYAQGAATHMTLGILLDEAGADTYTGKGLMHGCGHDYSCAILLDRSGNDTYLANDLSQGAGSANGVGLLIDLLGDDRYLVKNPKNTQGFGDGRREFGSIGALIDMSGVDQYNGNGKDNYFWRSDSRWGGGMDFETKPVDTTGKKP
jgi:hypothetical protein